MQSEIYETFFYNSPFFMVVIDKAGIITNSNPSFKNWLKDMSEPTFSDQFIKNLLNSNSTDTRLTFDNDISNRITNWTIASQTEHNFYLIGSDVTDATNRERTLISEASTDSLTKIMNRKGLIDNLNQLLETSTDKEYSLILFDLDGFKRVNDSLGHCVGDQILEQVAQRCKETIRGGDIVARLGGDEFAIIAPCKQDNSSLANRVLCSLSKPYIIGTKNITYISASIGKLNFVKKNKRKTESKQLLQIADELMYQSKRLGKNKFVSKSVIL